MATVSQATSLSNQRLIPELFPEAANGKELPDLPKYAAGIVKIHARHFMDRATELNETIVLVCSYEGRPFSRQPLATNSDSFLEAFIPELPYQKEIDVAFWQGTNELGGKLEVIHEIGIYLIEVLFEKTVISACSSPCPQPNETGSYLINQADANADAPFNISFAPDGKVSFKRSSCHYWSIENKGSSKIRILFFEIAGIHPSIPFERRRHVITIFASPKELKFLPDMFLRKSWEAAYYSVNFRAAPTNTPLVLLRIQDVTLEERAHKFPGDKTYDSRL